MPFDGLPLPLPPNDVFTPSLWHDRIAERSRRLVPEALSPSVLRILYEFALTRNAWGTTNLDAAPIQQRRVGDLRDAYLRHAEHHAQVTPTELEVLRYFDLLSDLPRHRFPVSRDDVLAVHAEYFRDVPLDNRGRAGHWKTRTNIITGPGNRITETSAPRDVTTHLENLLDWWNALEDPGPEHVALFFHAFQRIHPFDDGNGRAGRVLCLQLLSSIGYENIRYCPIDDTLNRERAAYHAALIEADVGRPEHWLALFVSAIDDGYRRAVLLGTRLQALPTDLDAHALDTLAWAYIQGRTSFRPAEIKHLWPNVTARTRQRHLAALVAIGALHADGSTRDRTYSLPGGLVRDEPDPRR